MPPNISAAFGGNGFFVFGRLAFLYQDQSLKVWQGPSHWLEAQSGILFPERPDPVAFSIALKPGLTLTWEIDAGVDTQGVGAMIGGQIASMVLGELAPFL